VPLYCEDLLVIGWLACYNNRCPPDDRGHTFGHVCAVWDLCDACFVQRVRARRDKQ